jgi:hypothetical protein
LAKAVGRERVIVGVTSQSAYLQEPGEREREREREKEGERERGREEEVTLTGLRGK